MSSAGGTRLPTQQPCYFGYGVGRPRKGAKNQCAAYEKNKKERGWRTEGLLRQQVTEMHNAFDGTDGWVTAGASRRHRLT